MRFQFIVGSLILATGSLCAQAPPVPAAYQDLYNTLSTQISSFNTVVNAGWNGSSYPYLAAPQLQSANSDQFTLLLAQYYYSGIVTEQLEEHQALGANAVTVHLNFPIFYQPFYTYIGNPALYQQFVSFYQQLVSDIRARGMKVVVEASVGLPLAGNNVSQFQPYFDTLSWSDYMTGRAANDLAVAQLLQPDYMTVMTEPDSEETVTGQTNLNTVSGVTQIVQQILTALQQGGVTNVQVGAGVGTWTPNYTQYLQALTALPLDFVDMHIYPINGTDFTAALAAADTIHAAGKQVGLSEFWDWKVRDNELGVLNYATITARDPFSFWQPIDTAFLGAIANFAKYKQLSFISPYWTNYFFSYLDYNTYGSLALDTLLTDSYAASNSAIGVGGFTPTGHAWESLNVPPDTTPPATPAAPTAPVIGPTGINVQLPADTDNVGISAYNVYRDGQLLTATSGYMFDDMGLVPGETYTYALTAVDASGNVSGMSPPLVVETIDTTPPSVPTNLVVTNVTPTAISLSWTPSTGIGGVGGYRILRGTSPTSMSIQGSATTPPYSNQGQPSTTYYYQVESYNPLGITSAPSNMVSATFPAWNCSYSVGNLPAGSIAGAGGTVTVSVTTATGCNWIAYSGSPGAAVTSGSTGVGNGSVSITFASNTSGAPLNFALIIAGQTVNLTQAVDPALDFFPLTPCRIADTRVGAGFSGSFGPPYMTGGSQRSFPIPSSSCSVPGNAQAYSLNITVIPHGALGYLTAWPTGSPLPLAATLNSPSGTIVGNAAVVPGGTGGAISLYVSNDTDVVIDINGYFAAPGDQAQAFYPVTPCRVADTRANSGFTGGFGPPSLVAGATRAFDVPASSCAIPSAAQAYSVRMTAVPPGSLGYLTTWPAAQPFPIAATLNAPNGGVVGNEAIVPSGTGGAIDVYASGNTDLVIDINGYFAPPGSPGGLQFYPITPCRVADTRTNSGFTGAFGSPALAAGASRDFPLPSSACGIPSSAQAYWLNLTAINPTPPMYLTAWQTGQSMPLAATVNAAKGGIVGSGAIVPAGTNGSISVFASNATNLVIDINGYFAP